MKFSCERCGKKYATAETPAPGKVYKLKCKACGHLIVVRASAAAAAAQPSPRSAPEALAPEAGAQPAAPAPDVLLEVGAPEPAAPSNGASTGAPQLSADATSPLELASPTPPPAALPQGENQPPADDGGYVDLFSDLMPDASAGPEAAKPDDPFLPGAASDPFAPLAREHAAAAAAAQPSRPTLQIPEIPKPPPQKSGLPIALIGAGVAVLVGILAFVLLGLGKKAPVPATARPAVQAEAPRWPQPPPPIAPPPAEPVQVPAPAPPPTEAERPEPSRPPEGDRPRTDDRRRRDREQAQAARDAKDRERRAREDRAAKERERKQREAADRERRDRERLAAAAAQSEGDAGLTQAQIESVLRSTKKAFDSCLQSARGAESKLDGRRVMLRLNIQPSGAVTYPTLDDVTLSGTDVGSCLKSAARLMVFPKFKGETMHVEVPLVMR